MPNPPVKVREEVAETRLLSANLNPELLVRLHWCAVDEKRNIRLIRQNDIVD
jgi:hypothetical protein